MLTQFSTSLIMSDTPEWPPTPEAMQSLLPAYEFTATVTSSNLGAVFFANQKSLERQVAFKVFSPALAADTVFRKAFADSSKLAAGLRHSNLIGLLDSGEVAGMLYLVMEFVPGKSLARSTQGQIVEFGQSLALIDAISEGVAHAHDAGLVHGHLDNLSILLNQHALPKIGNFGFGRTVHTDPKVVTPVHFTAPEVLADPTAATKASDVFSVAALFYGLITGKSFSPHAPAPSTVCGCHTAVDSVLKRATDPSPHKRYADAREFQSALKQATAKSVDRVPAAPASNPKSSAPQPKTGYDVKLLAKIALIIVLLIAIKFTWEFQKKVRTDREKENKEILAKKKFAKDQAAALVAEIQALEDRKRPAVQPDYSPAERGTKEHEIHENPAKSLARLRSDLADGERLEMPVGSVKKGDRTYFLVEEGMPWMDASYFAEQHGAYLADPSVDLGWLDAELTKGRKCWLGAARSGGDSWVLSDGKPWSPAAKPMGTGLFLVIARSGELDSEDAHESHPFVIEWRDDGSNPGSLVNLLSSTRASLGEATPVYPPGTVISGERRYLFVNRPITWSEAKEISKSSGGHLLVASASEEIEEVAKITDRIKVKEGIWLGGSLEEDLWEWGTGEVWQAADWADDSNASEEGVALALRPGDGWVAIDRGDIADGFLIEWSEDEKAPKPDSNFASGNSDVSDLDSKVEELILAAVKKREDEHAGNIKRLHWDLDSYLRNLSGSDKDQFGYSVNALKELVDDNRLDVDKMQEKADTREIILSREMLKTVNYHCEKQVEIDKLAVINIGKIRDAYVTRVTAIKDEAKAIGQIKVVADLEEMIEDTEDLESWSESFGSVQD